MKVCVIQSKQCIDFEVLNLHKLDESEYVELKEETLAHIYTLLEEAGRLKPDLIVTPEAVNAVVPPSFKNVNFKIFAEPLNGEVINNVRHIANKYKTHIVIGLYTERDNKIYNSGVFIGPNGEIIGIYDKVHLAVGEEVNLTEGNEFKIFECELGKIGILICWDMQFPEAARILTLCGAELIVCPTWGWENKYGLCRAYENGIYIVAAMAVPKAGFIPFFQDPSCIVSNTGEVLIQARRDEVGIISGEIDIKKYPPLQYGITSESGYSSMREVRILRRRPELYKKLIEKD